jgi:hypothetical protein
MRILTVHDDRSRFFQELAGAKRRVLVVDYDSVIAPQSVSGNSSVPYPTISELLDCIMTTSRTQVVLITDGQAEELAPAVPGPAPDICGIGGSADPEVMLPDMLAKLGEDTAVAFIGDRAHSFAMIPEIADDGGAPAPEGAAGESQEFVQFLVDWLRVCGGEIC